MDLATKFKMVASCQQTKITSLKIDMPYPIERAERVVTKYGEAILMTLQAESPQTFVKVFLPRRYGSVFSDGNLCSINEEVITLSLKYLGNNTTSNSYILEL
jgi:hypothetical protein